METEIEAKFTQIDIDKTRVKLRALGAACEQPMHEMKRVTIDTPEMKAKNAFVRIRDQGDKITVTYKQFDSLSLHGAQEIEIEVNDFDKTVKLFTAVDRPHFSSQESRRETWQLGDAEIVIDEWPWLDPYLEIEGPDEQSVKKVASDLKLDWDKAVFGDVMSAYKIQYPHIGPHDTIGNLPEVKFGAPLPDIFKTSK
ncbi:MAG: class IV adenylate cyclase [Candidatus Saccharibacteria bacterium]